MKINSVVLCSIAALAAASPTPKRRRDVDASNAAVNLQGATPATAAEAVADTTEAAPIPDASFDNQDAAEATLPSIQELTDMWEKAVREAQAATPEVDLSFMLPKPEDAAVNRAIPPSSEAAPSMQSSPVEMETPTAQEFAAMWEKALREAQASRPDLDLSSMLPSPENMMVRRNIQSSTDATSAMESAPADDVQLTIEEFAEMWEKAVREAQKMRSDLDLSSLLPVPEDLMVRRSIPPAADVPNNEQAPAEDAMPSAQAIQELTEMWEKAVKEAKETGILAEDQFNVDRIPAEEFEEKWNHLVSRLDAEAVAADPPKKSSSNANSKAGSGMSSSSSASGHNHGGSSSKPAAAEEPVTEEPMAEPAPVEEAPMEEEASQPKSKGKGAKLSSKGCANKAKNDACADKVIGAGGLGMLGGLNSGSLGSGGLGSLGLGSGGLGSLGLGSGNLGSLGLGSGNLGSLGLGSGGLGSLGLGSGNLGSLLGGKGRGNRRFVRE